MVVVLCGGSGFLPLFGGPGYEAALAAGLIVPSTVAAVVALEAAFREDQPFDAYARGIASGALLAALALATSLLHGLRLGFCDPLDGVALLVLGPGFGALLAGGWGALSGLAAAGVERRRRRILAALALGLAGPLCTIAFSLWRFLSSPMVFAFDPFFGHFAGPLYDTVIQPIDRLQTYRLGTLFTLLAGGVLTFHLERAERGALSLRGRGRPGLALSGALAGVASIALVLSGPRLGHYSTSESIREELERSLTSQRCEIVYAPSIPQREAEILARECDAHVRALERWFGAAGPERISVLVFESEGQKGRLMGAASTYIAKPWRNEIYIQFSRYPHPVMGHELAHVVAGSYARGPFRVAGPLSGWLPDPGRIEGVATAATPSDDPDFTLQQWSRAMLELGLLPPLSRVFRLSFLGENSSKAYTVAGAFVEWLHATRGPEAIRRWYSGESIEGVMGKGLGELEREWRDALTRVELPRQALETARARFDRPAIFGRKCPHEVDRLAMEGHGRLVQGDHRGARERFERVLSLDSENFGARMALGSCAARAGDEDEARRRWSELSSDPELHKLQRWAADEAIADLDLVRGDLAAARQRYREIADNIADEDRLRTLDVKSNPGSELGRQAIASLLIGDPRYGRDFGEAAALLGRWSAAEPEDGLASYLLGRNLYNGGRYESAATWLDSALTRNLSLARVRSEALRMRVLAGCAQGDLTSARAAYRRWRDLESIDAGARAALGRVARRCGIEAD